MSDEIAVAVMSHPSRGEMAADLIAEIEAPVFLERDDHERGPWPTARRAWGWGISTDKPWVLLLQDDIRITDDLIWHCHTIASLGPRCVCLHCFDSQKRRDAAQNASGAWMQIRFSTWGQGVLMPRSWARHFLWWCEKHVPVEYPHDDTRLTWWLQEQRKSAWVPVPNLICHRDVPSTLGHPRGETLAFEKSISARWEDGLDDAPIVRGSPIDSRFDHTDLDR